MNEKGFFTLIGICFLLVAAILVKGVQESERNYSYITQDFRTEAELQNIAESALIEAVNMIDPDNVEKTVPKRNMYFARKKYQPKLIDKKIDKDTTVKVFAEYGIDQSNNNVGTIQRMKREYKSNGTINDSSTDIPDKKGVILISVASRDTDNGKVYRRAMGYFLTNEDADGKIYFMNSLD